MISHRGPDAVARLADLGLEPDDLIQPLLAGLGWRNTATDDHPLGAGSTLMYFEMTAALRVRLRVKGWTADNSFLNQARTVRGDGRLAIVVATGDDAVGIDGLVPTTKNKKGEALANEVAANAHQLALFGEDMPEWVGATTWLFMPNVLDSLVRAELSLPNSMTESGFVASWSERIILDPIPLSGVDIVADDDEGDGDSGIEVAVAPR